MFNFTPDEQIKSGEIPKRLEVPFIEDARADYARLYASKKPIREAARDIEQALLRLGAVQDSLTSGKFIVNGQERFGYVLRFHWGHREGMFPIAGLPIRNHTPARERQVRVQALLNIAAWLDTCIALQVFSPRSYPLAPYLLDDGKQNRAVDLIVQKLLPERASDEKVSDIRIVNE